MSRTLHPSVVGNVLTMRIEDPDEGLDPVLMRFEFHEQAEDGYLLSTTNEHSWPDWELIAPTIGSIACALARENEVDIGKGPRFETALEVISLG